MKAFVRTHKWKLIVITLIAVFCAIYLWAAYQPGLWLQDVFLYRQEDGSFQGSTGDIEYVMQLKSQDGYSEIIFTRDHITRRYEVFYDKVNLSILQDGESIFAGTYTNQNGFTMFSSPDDPYIGIDIYASAVAPDFPSRSWLFHRAIDPDTHTRGNPSMLFVALFFGLLLYLDLRFPDLFFHLKFMWHVDGGEPTTWYRAMQMVGRFLLIIAILVCLIKGFV